MGWLSTLQVNTPWLGQDNPMAIFMNSYFASTHNDRESFGTVVCYLSVFLQCSGQVHSCSQLQNVPPLSPPFSTLAHQTSLYYSSSLASMWSHRTNTLHYHHGYLLESDPNVQSQSGTLYQWPSICQQPTSSLPVCQRDPLLLLEDNLEVKLRRPFIFNLSTNPMENYPHLGVPSPPDLILHRE